MPLIQRPGEPELFYEVDDFTDPWANAPCLILQHGYGRSSKFWFQWVPYLCRYFKVIRPDLRGLGRSGKDFDFAAGVTAGKYVDDIRSIVRDLGDGPVHYCGESIGGILGLAFAGAYPELVRSLALVSAPVFFSEGARKDYACGYASWPEAVRKMGPEPWLKQTNTSTRFPPDMSPGFLDWYNQNVAAAGVEMLARMAEFALNTDVTPYLTKIEAPVLCLYPTGGAIANQEQQALLEKHVRKIRFLHLPTPYHMIHYIKPALCARQVLSFAAGVDGRVCDE
jgi:3-oxoadipate enol-lactonase